MSVATTIQIRGSFGFVHTFNRTVVVEQDCLKIVSHSGKTETYPFAGARIACCEHWEAKAGLIGPVSSTKLHVMLYDGDGKPVKMQYSTKPKWWESRAAFAEFYVDKFTRLDGEKLRTAIRNLRPDMIVSDKLLDSMLREERATFMAQLKDASTPRTESQ